MKIRINEANMEKIANAIIEVEGTRVRERKLSATQVLRYTAREKMLLKNRGIKLKDVDGYTVEFDVNYQRFYKAYDKASHGKKPQSTHFVVTWFKGVPYLTDVRRVECWTKSDRKVISGLNDVMQKALIENFKEC